MKIGDVISATVEKTTTFGVFLWAQSGEEVLVHFTQAARALPIELAHRFTKGSAALTRIVGVSPDNAVFYGSFILEERDNPYRRLSIGDRLSGELVALQSTRVSVKLPHGDILDFPTKPGSKVLKSASLMHAGISHAKKEVMAVAVCQARGQL